MRFLPQFIAFGSVLPFLAGANLNVGGIELLKPLPERVEISRGLQHYSHGLYSKVWKYKMIISYITNKLFSCTTGKLWELRQRLHVTNLTTTYI